MICARLAGLTCLCFAVLAPAAGCSTISEDELRELEARFSALELHADELEQDVAQLAESQVMMRVIIERQEEYLRQAAQALQSALERLSR